MKTKTINIFSFNELKNDVQKKVLNEMRHINVDGSDWSEPMQEGFCEELEGLGYKQPTILFSGFSSQGDGACFTAKLDIPAIIHRLRQADKYKNLLECAERGDCDGNITHKWRYYFATSTTVSIDQGNSMSDEALTEAGDLESFIEAEREILGNRFYKELGNYYDELTSDEAIKETIALNEYTFREDGTMENY